VVDHVGGEDLVDDVEVAGVDAFAVSCAAMFSSRAN